MIILNVINRVRVVLGIPEYEHRFRSFASEDHKLTSHIIKDDHYHVGCCLDDHIIKAEDIREHLHYPHIQCSRQEAARKKISHLLKYCIFAFGLAVKYPFPVRNICKQHCNDPGYYRTRDRRDPEYTGTQSIDGNVYYGSQYAEYPVGYQVLISVPEFLQHPITTILIYLPV